MPSPTSTSATSRTPSSVDRGTATGPLVEIVIFLAIDVLAAVATTRGAIPSPEPTGGVVWPFLASFTAVTALFLILLRRLKSARFFTLLFSVAVFVGVASLGDALFGIPGAVVMGSSAVLLWYLLPRVAVYDAVLILGLAGIAAVLGRGMSPLGTVIILSILALYDVIAVYGTKHMVVMARELVRRKAFFAIIIPDAKIAYWSPVSSVVPGSGYRFIGTGDAAIPALLVASVARWEGLLPAAAVAAGSLVGLAGVYVLFSRQRRPAPMPALPPIALGAIVAYLLTILI